ncbi:DUF748 domain-containing protein [Alistipes sp.]|uniref:DUF748 domain-containing protein n=1 Tax=Alistipes sp. TaxID=1872444 RepID=UPI003AEF77DA
MKKTARILLITAAVLVVLLVAAAIALPPLARRYIEKHDRELLGRSIRIERLRFNLFTGRLRIHDLRIGEAGDTAGFFRLDSFDMRLRLWPLLGRRVHIARLHLAAPDLKIYQRGASFNFDDLLARFAPDTTAVQAPEKPSDPWEIGIYDIAIRRGHIFYRDQALGATWGLNDLGLAIPGVYFSGEKTDVGAVLNFAEGGSLETRVAYDIASSEFDIGLRLRELTLAGMLPYVRQSLDIAGVEGRLWADLHLRGDLEHLLSLRAEGTASLAGFALRDRQQQTVAGIDTLGVQLAEADLGARRFRFDRIYASGLSARYEMTPEGDNLSALLRSPAAADTPPTPAAADSPVGPAPQPADAPARPAPTLRIADLEIASGTVELRDRTLHKPFEYRISDIRMRSRDFDPAGHNRLRIDARMQQTGSARLSWEGSLDDISNQNITLWLTNLDLRDFTPYCEHFTAYPVAGGNLTFRSQNVIRNRYLDGTNHLDVFEPKVDRKLRDLKPEMHIPLKLGLYVLRDKKGHVKMDLPVKGSLDTPEFSYRKIVLKAIGNVLLKVVTAPFSFLSGHGGDLRYIALDPAQYVFTSEQYASFDRIASMLRDKPEMHLVLRQRIDLGRALPAQTASALRMAYAAHLRAADSTAVAASGAPRMTMLEYEKMQQTDIRTPAVMAFADSLLTARGRSPQGLSAADKAMALYREEALGQLTRLMEARDRVLREYMRTTHQLTEPAFVVERPDSAARLAYTGRNRYTLALEMDGETVEIADDGQQAEEGLQNPQPNDGQQPVPTADGARNPQPDSGGQSLPSERAATQAAVALQTGTPEPAPAEGSLPAAASAAE